MMKVIRIMIKILMVDNDDDDECGDVVDVSIFIIYYYHNLQ